MMLATGILLFVRELLVRRRNGGGLAMVAAKHCQKDEPGFLNLSAVQKAPECQGNFRRNRGGDKFRRHNCLPSRKGFPGGEPGQGPVLPLRVWDRRATVGIEEAWRTSLLQFSVQ